MGEPCVEKRVVDGLRCHAQPRLGDHAIKVSSVVTDLDLGLVGEELAQHVLDGSFLARRVKPATRAVGAKERDADGPCVLGWNLPRLGGATVCIHVRSGDGKAPHPDVSGVDAVGLVVKDPERSRMVEPFAQLYSGWELLGLRLPPVQRIVEPPQPLAHGRVQLWTQRRSVLHQPRAEGRHNLDEPVLSKGPVRTVTEDAARRQRPHVSVQVRHRALGIEQRLRRARTQSQDVVVVVEPAVTHRSAAIHWVWKLLRSSVLGLRERHSVLAEPGLCRLALALQAGFHALPPVGRHARDQEVQVNLFPVEP